MLLSTLTQQKRSIKQGIKGEHTILFLVRKDMVIMAEVIDKGRKVEVHQKQVCYESRRKDFLKECSNPIQVP